MTPRVAQPPTDTAHKTQSSAELAPPHITRSALVRARQIVSWYFKFYYGKVEGPGCAPFYTDPSLVGSFAVAPDRLAAGEDDEVFRLAVGLAMFQARRDVDVMAIQERMAQDHSALISSAQALETALAQTPCTVQAQLEVFHEGCDVRQVATARDCTSQPGSPCAVKDASHALRRYGDFGKMPFSLALLPGSVNVQSMGALHREALRRHDTPRERACWLESLLCQAWRIDKKIANFILSALTNPDLTPGLHPWLEGLDWRWFVVLDRHVMRALVALGAAKSAKYDEHRTWLLALSARIDLTRYHPAVHANNPRLVQQAFYRFGSVTNRRATPQDCCHAGPAACQTCPAALRTACPVASP